MTDIIFRIYGIPMTQPKLAATGGSGWKSMPVDKAIRLRHPITGAALRMSDDLSHIDWPHGNRPGIKTDKTGVFWLQQKPRQAWKSNIQTIAWLFMRRHELKPFGPDIPLIMGTIFFIPGLKKKTLFPITQTDLDNYRYPIWNALKNNLCYHDDTQICWEHEGGKVWADAENPPGAIVWIKSIDVDRYKMITAKVNLYKRKLEIIEKGNENGEKEI